MAPEIVAAIIAGIISLVSIVYTGITRRNFAHLEANLSKKERLEASRSAGYAEIWKLTDSLNLFGSKTEVNVSDLSDHLKNWYFEHGWVLSRDSKKRYFLIQEALHFIDLCKVPVTRPSDESLFGDRERPIKQLREMRKTTLGVEIIEENKNYEILQLEKYVSDWKTDINKNASAVKNESPWMLLQLLLSSFRSGILSELSSIDNIYESLE